MTAEVTAEAAPSCGDEEYETMQQCTAALDAETGFDSSVFDENYSCDEFFAAAQKLGACSHDDCVGENIGDEDWDCSAVPGDSDDWNCANTEHPCIVAYDDWGHRWSCQDPTDEENSPWWFAANAMNAEPVTNGLTSVSGPASPSSVACLNRSMGEMAEAAAADAAAMCEDGEPESCAACDEMWSCMDSFEFTAPGEPKSWTDFMASNAEDKSCGAYMTKAEADYTEEQTAACAMLEGNKSWICENDDAVMTPEGENAPIENPDFDTGDCDLTGCFPWSSQGHCAGWTGGSAADADTADSNADTNADTSTAGGENVNTEATTVTAPTTTGEGTAAEVAVTEVAIDADTQAAIEEALGEIPEGTFVDNKLTEKGWENLTKEQKTKFKTEMAKDPEGNKAISDAIAAFETQAASDPPSTTSGAGILSAGAALISLLFL